MDKQFEEKFDELKKHINAASIARMITRGVIRHSVSATVVTIVNNLAPEATTRKEKIELYIAVWALSGIAADKAGDYANDKFDGYYAIWQKLKPSKSEVDPEIEVPVQEEPTPE